MPVTLGGPEPAATAAEVSTPVDSIEPVAGQIVIDAAALPAGANQPDATVQGRKLRAALKN